MINIKKQNLLNGLNNTRTDKEKYEHISVATCKIKLQNGSTITIYGYDEVADFMLRNLHENDMVDLAGKLESKMCINIQYINTIIL